MWDEQDEFFYDVLRLPNARVRVTAGPVPVTHSTADRPGDERRTCLHGSWLDGR
jgi:hypothetical protein